MIAKAQQNAMTPMEAYVMAMSGNMAVAIARRLRDEDLSMAEFAALHLLRRGPLRVSELGDTLLRPLPAASRIASSLVTRGLVERREDETDRRAKVLSLSTKGRNLLEGQASIILREIGQTLVGMNSEIGNTLLPIYEQFAGREVPGKTKAPGGSTGRPTARTKS